MLRRRRWEAGRGSKTSPGATVPSQGLPGAPPHTHRGLWESGAPAPGSPHLLLPAAQLLLSFLRGRLACTPLSAPRPPGPQAPKAPRTG